MKALWTKARAWLARILGPWNRFWFAPSDARPVGIMRILLGIIAIWTHLSLLDELPHILGPDAELWQPLSAIRWASFSFYDHVTSTDQLYGLHIALVLPLVLFTVGLGGRFSNLMALVVLASVHHGNTWMLNAGDRLVRLWMLSMLFVPATRAFSLDAWILRKLGRSPKATLPVVTQRLVQIQLAWMYMATGLAKAEGSTWHDGTAVYYALNAEVFQRFPGLLPDTVLAWWPIYAFLALGTWVTLIWEIGFPFMVLWRPTRLLALALGVFIHGGIAAGMMVASFSFASVWGYWAFLDQDKLSAYIDKALARVGIRPPLSPGAPDLRGGGRSDVPDAPAAPAR